VPLIDGGHLWGVLDLDSPTLARFDEMDQAGCEQLVALFVEHHRRYPDAIKRCNDDRPKGAPHPNPLPASGERVGPAKREGEGPRGKDV